MKHTEPWTDVDEISIVRNTFSGMIIGLLFNKETPDLSQYHPAIMTHTNSELLYSEFYKSARVVWATQKQVYDVALIGQGNKNLSVVLNNSSRSLNCSKCWEKSHFASAVDSKMQVWSSPGTLTDGWGVKQGHLHAALKDTRHPLKEHAASCGNTHKAQRRRWPRLTARKGKIG